MLSQPPYTPCDPSSVISHLENRYNIRLLQKGETTIRTASDDMRIHLSSSNGKRYPKLKQWFIKLSKSTLSRHESVVVWSKWTPFGWIIPSEILLHYFNSNNIKATDGRHWDPRIGIDADGKGKLWTDEVSIEPLDVTKFHINFEAASALPRIDAKPAVTKSDEAMAAAIRLYGKDFDFADNIESAVHLQRRAEQDQLNSELGYKGERLVYTMEKRRLQAAGMGNAADQVRLVAAEKGSDSKGYDISSISLDGKPRWIEVKTTRGGANTPFYISANELAVSERNPETWSLIRIFGYGSDIPGFYEIHPSIQNHASLVATSHRATPSLETIEQSAPI